MKLIQQDHTDVVFVQEPYLCQNKTAGITRSHSIYTSNEEKHRTTFIIANGNIDAVLIKQLSDRDTVVIEVRCKSIRILAASIYFDINEERSTKYYDAARAPVCLSPWTAIPDQLHGTTGIQPEAKHHKNI